MKIFIKRTKNAQTAPKFVKNLKNCEEGYNVPEGEYFVINYGRSSRGCNLNNSLILNKKHQLDVLKSKGILVPDIVCERYYFLSISRVLFPLLARKIKHFGGKDIMFLRTRGSMFKRIKRVKKRDFFVKYIPKEAEFRVHVLGDTVVNICKKIHSNKTGEHHPHIWCNDRGWTLIDYSGEHFEELKELGLKAKNALEYDFGAVDIGLGKDGKFYVFEVNSAPRLNLKRRRLYAKYFREKETKERE